ncbi:MAG: radical SAM protein [archaeon]|nr:radical SAM protein [archaeon]
MGVSLVFGPAETVWGKILNDVKNGTLKSKYFSEPLKNLRGLPTPNYSGFNRADYDEHAFLFIESSRGCPRKCTFCDASQYNPGFKFRPLNEIVNDIETIKDKTGMSNFHFTDSNLLIGNRRSYALFKLLEDLDISFGCSSDMEFITPDSIVAAAKAGCRFISMGIESLNENNLAYCDKRFNDPTRVKEIIETCKDQGISLYVNIIFGFDYDTEESCMVTVDKLIQYKADVAHFHVLDPTIGTPLYESLLTQGRIIGKANNGLTMFKPGNMTYQGVCEIVRKANLKFYSDDSINFRVSSSKPDILVLNKQFQENTRRAGHTPW